MRKHTARAMLVAGAMALTTLATATPSQAAPGCAANAVCLWTKANGGGQLYTWKGGYIDLPSQFTDHVGSFRANRSAGFIDWKGGTKACRTVRAGDYADNYQKAFGKLIDAVGDKC